MRFRGFSKLTLGAILIFCALIGLAAKAEAETLRSDNFQVTESDFSSGMSLDPACSDSYCATITIGELNASPGSSASYTTAFGDLLPDEPALDLIIDRGASNLGVLTTENTSSTEMIVRIRTFLGSGYTLQIMGDAPSYQGHKLKTPTRPTLSQAGVEQFGINAVANSLLNIGADPVQVPSAEFSGGVVEGDYALSDEFMYNSGDVIARSTSGTGRTDYTISMIVNISGLTKAGSYSGDFSAVVTPLF